MSGERASLVKGTSAAPAGDREQPAPPARFFLSAGGARDAGGQRRIAAPRNSDYGGAEVSEYLLRHQRQASTVFETGDHVGQLAASLLSTHRWVPEKGMCVMFRDISVVDDAPFWQCCCSCGESQSASSGGMGGRDVPDGGQRSGTATVSTGNCFTRGVNTAFREMWQLCFQRGGGVTADEDTLPGRAYPEASPGRRRRVLVQHASGLFHGGGLHAIVALQWSDAIALLECIIGRRPSASGEMWLEGWPYLSSTTMQSLFGVVTRHNSWAYPEFSVEQNLNFAVQMNTVADPASFQTRIAAVLEATKLSADWQVSKLSRYQRLRVDLAMELVADPPVLAVGTDVFEVLDAHESVECTELLRGIAIAMGKTVIVATTNIPICLFFAASSLTILGAEGRNVFSGTPAQASDFFSRIRVSHQTVVALNGPTPLGSGGDGRPAPSSIHSGDLSMASFRLVDKTPPQTVGPTDGSFDTPSTGGSGSARNFTRTPPPPPLPAGVHQPGNPSGLSALNHHHYQPISVDPTSPSSATAPRVGLRLSVPGTAAEVSGTTIMDIVERLATNDVHTAEVATIFYDGVFRRTLVEEQQTRIRQSTTNDQQQPSDNPSSPTSPCSNPVLRASHSHRPRHSFTQFLLLSKMTIWQAVKQTDFYIIWAMLFVLLGFCIYLLSSQQANTMGLQNRRGIYFMLFFLAIGVNGPYVPQYYYMTRRYLHMRARSLTNPFSHLLIFIGQTALQRALYLSTFSLFVYLSLGAQQFGPVSLLGVTSFVHASVVYLIVLLTGSAKAARFVVGVFDVYTVVFCGYLINLQTLGPFLPKTSLLRFGYGTAFAQGLVGTNLTNYDCDVPASLNVSSPCYVSGESQLADLGFENDTMEFALQWLMIYAIGALVLCFSRLYFLRR